MNSKQIRNHYYNGQRLPDKFHPNQKQKSRVALPQGAIYYTPCVTPPTNSLDRHPFHETQLARSPREYIHGVQRGYWTSQDRVLHPHHTGHEWAQRHRHQGLDFKPPVLTQPQVPTSVGSHVRNMHGNDVNVAHF